MRLEWRAWQGPKNLGQNAKHGTVHFSWLFSHKIRLCTWNEKQTSSSKLFSISNKILITKKCGHSPQVLHAHFNSFFFAVSAHSLSVGLAFNLANNEWHQKT